MAQNEDLSSLERVRQRLYNPKVATEFEQPHLSERRVQPASGWEKLRETELETEGEVEHISGPARFFIVAFLFFLVTAGGAAFYLLYGGRSVSTNNIVLTIQGPTTIASGDTVPLQL